jgi:hypothetical protein
MWIEKKIYLSYYLNRINEGEFFDMISSFLFIRDIPALRM